MNNPEAFVASYYERVRKYAIRSNVRFPGPAGRNWTDLDIVALPTPLLDGNGERRPAHIVQVKWRAKFTLGVGNEEWLDQSVVNSPEFHQQAVEVLGDWPYRMVLVTTRVWLSTVSDVSALVAQLDESAKAATTTCVGAKLLTFEEIAEEWRLALGTAVRGWAEDPFSFLLQVHQLGQTAPPGEIPLPPAPQVDAADAEIILTYDHDDEEHRGIAETWFTKLLALQRYKVLEKGPYESGDWMGLSARVWGKRWVFFGRVGSETPPVLSVWDSNTEILRFELRSQDSLRRAALRLVAAFWW